MGYPLHQYDCFSYCVRRSETRISKRRSNPKPNEGRTSTAELINLMNMTLEHDSNQGRCSKISVAIPEGEHVHRMNCIAETQDNKVNSI